MEEEEEENYEDSQDSDQQQTQSTQQASQQPPSKEVDAHLWGYLSPCNPGPLTRIDFWKIHPKYTIGRNIEINQVVFPGFKVSNQHAVITWDGNDVPTSSVVVEDKSSNGTFINGERIGKGHSRILREGNEIAFGTSIPQPQNNGLEDYRFIYRHTAGGTPTEGLYTNYDLGSELGKGSFAIVRKAVHKSTGVWYAVKMIYPNKSVGQQSSKNDQLVREISIMEKLKHRNICKLFEVFFQADNSINLVLELIEGGDLLEHILKNEGLSEVDSRDITYQICHAMAYIHSRGVTHRDLKPENVLLTNHRPPVVKVADFGLAKVVDHATMLKTMCGTPSYLAPEVVSQKNNEGYDNLVDSWSVGVIVFSMISNASPFIEDETQQIRERILLRKIDWETLQARYPTEDATHFIQALLQVMPTRRLSLTSAVLHPWLAQHIPYHPPDFDETILPTPTANGSVMNMSHPTVPPGPEPSWELLGNGSEAMTTSPAPAPNSKGQNKRARGDLSTLDDDSLDDVYHESDVRKGLIAAPQEPEEDTSGGRRASRRAKVARRS
ncbi:kinase-like domain-containing protein [Crepidotus variabilis]|uniref:Kinase-like domain-containing protein n=1 Tax=Crepidotus variabilis TaxID=179855 RepID=A0A9P6EME8_9AGAR|nr:kinase-like domain-containing protein [Crepidotus variabilis]